MGQDSRWPPRGPLQLTGVVGGTLVALPGGTSELVGGSRHGACVLPVSQPQRPPAPHSTHHTRRPGLAAWSQLSPEAGKAVAPWTGSCRAASLAPGLLLWTVAVCACGTLSPAPWRRARGPGVGGRPEPARRSPLVCRGRAGTCLPGPRCLAGREIRSYGGPALASRFRSLGTSQAQSGLHCQPFPRRRLMTVPPSVRSSLSPFAPPPPANI